MSQATMLGQTIRDGLRQALADVAAVTEIRGDGLMIGIELDRDCGELVQLALDAGLLINVTADRVIRLLPPLIFSEAEAQELVTTLSRLIREYLGK